VLNLETEVASEIEAASSPETVAQIEKPNRCSAVEGPVVVVAARNHYCSGAAEAADSSQAVAQIEVPQRCPAAA
jgi:hypothetical protein